MKHLCYLALFGLVLALPPSRLEPAAHAAAGDAVCMVASTGGAAAGRQFMIVVPVSQVATMTARGFAEQPCQDRQSIIPKYQQEVCKLAAAPPVVQSKFAETYKASPAELCQMANGVVGGG